MVRVVELPIMVIVWPAVSEAAEGGEFQGVLREFFAELDLPACVAADLVGHTPDDFLAALTEVG